jgi:hypothetical protein
MRRILESNNKDLQREIAALRNIILNSKFPDELNPYAGWIMNFLAAQEEVIVGNLRYLSMNIGEIWSEVLERTQSITRNLRIISNKFITPISRYHSSDYICICLIKWLHEQHPQSKNVPFAVSDGQFSIYPSVKIPIIYYLPSSSRRSLLHLALFFHEYGHFLFQYHEKEMIDLIRELQDKLEELLSLPFQQNDRRSTAERSRVKKIIETWFDWIEELFCDAVGLVIGGGAFLKTFSLYLRMSGREAFYLTENDLQNSMHPVSFVRIKFLVSRAKQLGLIEEAKQIEVEWNQLSMTMGLQQVYHGYYAPSYDSIITEALDCMLEEASPICFKDQRSENSAAVNFVHLITEAWDRLSSGESEFESWQDAVLDSYL